MGTTDKSRCRVEIAPDRKGHGASVKNYDILGDIHGHSEELRQLLTRLGYQWNAGDTEVSQDQFEWVAAKS